MMTSPCVAVYFLTELSKDREILIRFSTTITQLLGQMCSILMLRKGKCTLTDVSLIRKTYISQISCSCTHTLIAVISVYIYMVLEKTHARARRWRRRRRKSFQCSSKQKLSRLKKKSRQKKKKSKKSHLFPKKKALHVQFSIELVSSVA